MNKPKFVKKIPTCVILTICAGYCLTQSHQVIGAQSKASAVGRENPFADIPRVVQPASPSALQTLEPVVESPELFVQTIMLKFLDAESLKEAIGNMSSSYGTITTNVKNNSLIICDTQENLEKILTEIKKADKTPRQIMVEVVIVDVQLSDDTEIGINWDFLSNESQNVMYRQNFTTRLGWNIPDPNIAKDKDFNTTGLGGDFSVINNNIRNVVSMLQQKKDVEILASPRVMVLSGKTASIESVRELPYNEITDTAAGGVGALTSTDFKRVGVTLNVTATLTEEDLIFLTVNSEQNVVVGESITEVPIIDTRNTRSEVLLKDGQVVIIGGLRRKEITKQANQIPILGDIPLLGLLFKYTNTVVTNTELIVFLSPHIYKEGEPIPEDAMEKYWEIKERPMPSLKKDKDAQKQPLIEDIKAPQ